MSYCVVLCVSGDEHAELMGKEITDLKRNLNDETREKEAIQKAAEELRGKVKKGEGERVELGRALQDARQRIASKYKCGIDI